jgi:hypothetical protein
MADVTSKDIVHEPGVVPLAAGMLRVAGSVAELAPAVATTAPDPVHVVDALGVAAITRFAGRLSTSAAPSDAAVLFALVSVIVTVETPFAAIEFGANDFASVGATALTVRLAEAGDALFPLDVVSAPAAMVLV